MALSEEQIKNIMVKDVESKTILVSPLEIEKVKQDHLLKGWHIYKETEINGRIKITFQKVK